VVAGAPTAAPGPAVPAVVTDRLARHWVLRTMISPVTRVSLVTFTPSRATYMSLSSALLTVFSLILTA
jgi:hypothetical protein